MCSSVLCIIVAGGICRWGLRFWVVWCVVTLQCMAPPPFIVHNKAVVSRLFWKEESKYENIKEFMSPGSFRWLLWLFALEEQQGRDLKVSNKHLFNRIGARKPIRVIKSDRGVKGRSDVSPWSTGEPCGFFLRCFLWRNVPDPLLWTQSQEFF